MKYYMYSTREFNHLLKRNGFALTRSKGGHNIWYNNDGRHISVPVEVNPMIARRLIKENGLKEK